MRRKTSGAVRKSRRLAARRRADQELQRSDSTDRTPEKSRSVILTANWSFSEAEE